MYIKVSNNLVTSGSFALPKKYKLPDGSTTSGLKNFTAAGLRAIGIYPLVDNSPAPAAWELFDSAAYSVGADVVTLTNSYSVIPLADYKQQAIQKVYQQSKQVMDAQTVGYSQAEIATWPAIQADVIAYNATTAIGAALQQAADTSAYSVAEVSAIITPKIAVQIAALSKRATLVTSINAAVDHAAVSLIGW